MTISLWTSLRVIICLLVVIYMVVPLVIVLIISFSSAPFLTFPPPGFSLQWYENFVNNPAWLRSLLVTIQVMIPTAVLTTILGTAAAFGISRSRFIVVKFVNGLLMAPLVVPVIITAAAMFGVFRIWGLYGNLLGLIVAHTVLTIPYVLSTVGTSIRLVDRKLEDAAANLGAKPMTTFRLITLPLIMPAVLSGLLFAMVLSFDELIVSLFISTPSVRPVTVLMWSNIRGDTDPTIAAIASVLFLFSLIALLLDALVRRKHKSGSPIM